MKKDVIHIYHGSQGSGGLYIHEIYSVLQKNNIKQEAFLSYYYPFKYGKKVFFKYTDLASGLKKSRLRIYLRGIELLLGLLYTYLYIIINRPKIINYSLISSYISDCVFLKLIKYTSNCKIILTCHDVIPFGENKESIEKQISTRKKIFSYADFFIVHNENSILDLKKVFDIHENKVFYHPFPLMDLHKINLNEETSTKKEFDFSFLGHLRDSKGIDILLEAWKLFNVKYPKAKLLLAGNLPDGSNLDLSGLEKYNIHLYLRYLSDEDYFTFLCKSRSVVLPYKNGTNSGVLYNLITMDVNIIYSDLLMFTSNPLLNENGKFLVNNVNSLFDKLCEFYIYESFKTQKQIDEYEENFNYKVDKVYRELLNIKI